MNKFEQPMATEQPIEQQQPVVAKAITEDSIKKAYETLQKYKQGKANLDNRIVENEQWYKRRHWDYFQGDAKKEEIKPVSAWLFNCLANKHADAMDNFPSPNILPREEGDKAEAEKLTSIIPVILDQNDFEQVYSDVWDYKLKTGTGVYGVFWDGSKLNGLGDISITKIDILNLFWEPGITDIQNSQNLFLTNVVPNDILLAKYPELQNKLGGNGFTVENYIYDDNVDTTDKSVVVDWYYKKNGVLHLCKFCNNVLLFASEDEVDEQGQSKYPNGWYEHGDYPFVFDTLYKVEGSPAGFGYIDIGKNEQEYIDRGDQAIEKNMLANTKPRYFVRDDGSVNIKEYADVNRDFVSVQGNSIADDCIRPIIGKPLSDIYVQVHNNKIEELKEVTGNRDISTGGTTSGVTAASAIAAMQEAGSKLSRDNSKAAYRAYKKLILLVIENIRQFYDAPRQFRIIGEDGSMRFDSLDNSGIKPQPQAEDPNQPIEFGVQMGLRKPLFDIEVTAQKASPYSKMSQNELALQFYSAGFFNPQLSDQALACIEMMDFDRKQFVMNKISQNGTMFQQMQMMMEQMMMMAGIIDQMKGSNLQQQIGMQFGLPQAPAPSGQLPEFSKEGDNESSVTKNARERVANSTSPV